MNNSNMTISNLPTLEVYIQCWTQRPALFNLKDLRTAFLLDGRQVMRGCRKKIQYRQSGQYLLYADYARRGLAQNRTFSSYDDNGFYRTRPYLVWTEKGRKFINGLIHGVYLY